LNILLRKLYVGNIPNNLNEPDLVEYVYRSLELAGGLLEPGNPVFVNILTVIKKYNRLFQQNMTLRKNTFS